MLTILSAADCGCGGGEVDDQPKRHDRGLRRRREAVRKRVVEDVEGVLGVGVDREGFS
jgi:hypothetical protein